MPTMTAVNESKELRKVSRAHRRALARAQGLPKPNLNGVILYEGPSMIDGKPIVVIAIFESNNSKTNNIVQTYIIRSDLSPIDAVKSGADVTVCGACMHRGNGVDGTGRTCYVNLGHGPRAVYQSYIAGNYPRLESGAGILFAGLVVRLGAYGDPAAVPVAIWDDALSQAAGWTGYSHQWRSRKLRDVMKYCQASADKPEDVQAATALGYGTFRVRPLKGAGSEILPGEFVCPASEEAGKVKTCAECRACDGSGTQVAIFAHGATAKKYTGERVRKLPVLQR